MIGMLNKLWHDPVWSKVISGIILALGAIMATYILDWWSVIDLMIHKSISIARGSMLISNWLLLLLVLLAIPMPILLLVIGWQSIFTSKKTSSSWTNYTSDNFFGLRWRWSFASDGRIYRAHTFCPYCDYQVYAKDDSSYRAVEHIAFHCDSCNRHLCDFSESYDSLENKAIRRVQQKLRSGAWVKQEE